MHVGKAVLMEELVQGERRLAAHAERSVEKVLVRGRRVGMVRRYSMLIFFFCSG